MQWRTFAAELVGNDHEGTQVRKERILYECHLEHTSWGEPERAPHWCDFNAHMRVYVCLL